MVNNYLFRLALVVNTSHAKFYDNLANIIVYVLYVDDKTELTVGEITQQILEKLSLEFTEKEILAAIQGTPSLFICRPKHLYSLSETGIAKVHEDRDAEMHKVIDAFRQEFNLTKTSEEVSSVVYKFLHGCLNQNIELLLNVIQGEKEKFSSIEYLSNEERKIVNDFIDWDNTEKNSLLVQLISFAVDYCRLTVKKDAKNFNTLLQGKRFYLDANIFFRMMGVNNAERQKSTMKFIEKCREAKIKLCYTSATRKEMEESIHYHVNEVKKTLQGYRGSGVAIENLYKRTAYEDGFITIYLKWCKESNTPGEYAEFEHFLMKKFFECAHDISLEDIKSSKVDQELVNSYIDAKEGKIRYENAAYDIQNVLFVDKKRNGNTSVGWNVNAYLISADHKLVDWCMNAITSVNPIVVLPSVWYSIILKINGRALDEEKSFVEFIKLRYSQDLPDHNVQNLISLVCRKTTNGEVQDLLFNEISSNNQELNKITFSAEEDDIQPIVDKKYEDILGKAKLEGFEEGKHIGVEEAYKKGESNGYESGKKSGERIGILKSKIEQVENETTKQSVAKWHRHILYALITFIASLILIYYISTRLSSKDALEVYKKFKFFVYIIPTGILTALVSHLFSLDLKKIKEQEEIKAEAQIRSLKNEIKSLENC